MSWHWRKGARRIKFAFLWYGVQPSHNHEQINFYLDDIGFEHVANPRKWEGWGAEKLVRVVAASVETEPSAQREIIGSGAKQGRDGSPSQPYLRCGNSIASQSPKVGEVEYR